MLFKNGREVKVGFTGLGGTMPIRVPESLPDPNICISRLPSVAGIDHIPEGVMVGGYDVVIANIFAHQNTVVAWKERYPDTKIIVRVDNPPEHSLFMDWSNIIRQVQAADLIGDPTETNARFYAGLTGKPYTVIPAPIGPSNWFAERWEMTRAHAMAEGSPITADDYILTTDHYLPNSYFDHQWCVANVAALAAIQRETGLQVVYLNATDAAKYYGKQVGLVAAYYPRVEFSEMLTMAMDAALGVDMYLMHTEGRHEVAMAALGLPTIGGNFTPIATNKSHDPYNALVAKDTALALLESPEFYATVRRMGQSLVTHMRSDEAIKSRVQQAVAMLFGELKLVEDS